MLPVDQSTGGRVVDTNQPIHLEGAKAGPFDVRTGQDFVEFVHSATVGLTHPEWRLASPQKIRVDAHASAESIEWTLEGKREAGRVKLRLKIRLGTRQMNLPLDEGGEKKTPLKTG